MNPSRRPLADVEALAHGIVARDRARLARAITLIESNHPADRAPAASLLERLLPRTGEAIRVGVTGPPGVGKSTFIERLGLHLLDEGHRLAVLAIDPSSTLRGGSILGDKTRMTELARRDEAFIRPSPSGGSLGGVHRKTRESILLCEAAGFDVVLVETVGVGQSELAVASMVDGFLALLLPGAGDELQGIKKGLLEVADVIAVNKCDGDNTQRARRAARELRGALRLVRPATGDWTPPVQLVSALEGTGVVEVWARLLAHREVMQTSGGLIRRRKAQRLRWLEALIDEGLRAAILADQKTAERWAEGRRRVAAGQETPAAAAEEILAAFLAHRR